MRPPWVLALVALVASAAAAPAVAGLLPPAPSLPSAGVLMPGQLLEVVPYYQFRPDHVLVAFALGGATAPDPPAHWVLVACGWSGSCLRIPFECAAGTIVVPPSYFDAYVGLDLVADEATAYAFVTEARPGAVPDTCDVPTA